VSTSTGTRTTTSADGTTIAYQAFGEGPAVVIVGGATNRKEDWVELAQALSEDGFSGVTYDRRGRGDSGDTRPFAVEREVEDLVAVIEAVGAPAGVHTISSGGAVAYRAIAAGAPIASMTAFETPYRVEGAPPPPAEYTDHLQELYDADRRGDMIEYFMTAAVGQPQEAVDQMKQMPFWDDFAQLGPTILYDGLQLGGGRTPLPTDLLQSIEVPVLCIASTGSPDWLRDAASAAADTLPDGTFTLLEGEFHSAPTQVVAPVLAAHHRH
jgi:pimeloyl-ACP methyl ester carboxylesterase